MAATDFALDYGAAQTLWHFEFVSDQVADENKGCVKAIHRSLNFFILTHTIEKRCCLIFKDVN